MQKAPWVTYRPEIKVLDCSIRDGGLINSHAFDDTLVKAVYQACIDAGVDYMEIGYKADQKIFASGQVWGLEVLSGRRCSAGRG